jgi:putative ABC transport system substrate-binding protein
VKLGLVTSFDRPGGNATGVSMLLNEMEAKRLGVLHELVPAAATIAVLLNPSTPGADTQSRDVQSAAPALGPRLLLLNASSEREIDAAFATLAQQRPGALLVAASAFSSPPSFRFGCARERLRFSVNVDSMRTRGAIG